MIFIIHVSLALAATLSADANEEGAPHCFKRVSAGERLIAYDVTRIVERNSVRGCEEECNIYKCTHFSFGTPPGGNGTCELTTDRQVSRRQDADFELYEKTDECAEGKPTGYEEGRPPTRSCDAGSASHAHAASYVIKRWEIQESTCAPYHPQTRII